MTEVKLHENVAKLMDNYIAAMREEMRVKLALAAKELASEIAGRAAQYIRGDIVQMVGTKGYEIHINFQILGDL